MFMGTRQVAALLGVRPSTLAKAIWDGRVPAPAKAPSGAYMWRRADIEHASWRLRGRGADDVLTDRAMEVG